MLLYLRNTDSDISAVKLLTQVAGSGEVVRTSNMLSSGVANVHSYVTGVLSNTRIPTGTWQFTLHGRLDPSEDTFPDEVDYRVQIYRRRSGINTLISTSPYSAKINGTTYSDRNISWSVNWFDLIVGDELYITIQARDSFSDSKIQYKIESITTTQTSKITLPAPIFPSTHQADSLLSSSSTKLHTTDTVRASVLTRLHTTDTFLKLNVGTPDWVTPTDQETIEQSEPLVFTIPEAPHPLHFEINVDRVDTFDSIDLRVYDSRPDQTNWEYWDGSAWETTPSTGVPTMYIGNQARYIPQDITEGTWYRRIRAISVEA